MQEYSAVEVGGATADRIARRYNILSPERRVPPSRGLGFLRRCLRAPRREELLEVLLD
jgi:hypothetical protein